MTEIEEFVQRGRNAQSETDRIINGMHAVNAWNEKHTAGTPVRVRLDDGTIKETITTSVAWMLGGHTAVVIVEGISGGYDLTRVSPR